MCIDDNLILWYKKPAVKWTEALPLGNGHIGAMVYGSTCIERLELTENTCYSGEASDENNQEGAYEILPQIRTALFSHEYKKAEQLASKIIGRKLNYGTNLPFGNLIIDFHGQNEEYADYRRELQLNNALSVVEYETGGVHYIRRTFVSNPHRLLIMHVSCSLPGKLCFTASMDSGSNPYNVELVDDRDIILTGNAYEKIHSDGRTGVTLYGRTRIKAVNGMVSTKGNTLQVTGADSAIVFAAIGTDFEDRFIYNTLRDRINAVFDVSFEDLLKIHIKDYQKLFHRVHLELGGGSMVDASTDERLGTVKNGAEDPWLTVLMFQYSRYLLISSSRENSLLPAHLQGIWNDDIACRMGWTCDLHLDINTEMNYWPSEVTNLSECSIPLLKWIEESLVPSGKQTAKITYGLDGWVGHTVSNVWGYSAPGWAESWGLHSTGGMWIATHMWEHFLFSKDMNFLKNHVLPVYREAVKFFLGFLVKDPDSGYYLSGPSISPENCFVYDWHNLHISNLSMGSVCDTVIIRELFNSFITACDLLGQDDPLLAETKNKLEKLPPFKIGKNGQLQEWFHDFDEPDTHHRHTSHLLSIFPFGQVTPDKTPELAKAANVCIKKRTSPYWRWEDTGFARAQLLLYSARLWESGEALKHVLAFQRGLTSENLLSFIPPCAGAVTNVFELDGSTGFCAGIAEMLLQSHNDMIHILPALPEKWGNGRVTGLRARGGYEINIEWENGKLVRLVIFSENGGTPVVKYADRYINMQIEKHSCCTFDCMLQPLKNESK